MKASNILEQIYLQTYASILGTSKQKNTFGQYNMNGNYQEISNFLENYIIQVIKVENEITVDDKINFLKYIIINSFYLTNLNDFYEEECHLSLLNWLWKERKSIKDNTNVKLLELLYNILIIFEILPIKPQDLIGLKLFEKINKIKGYVSKTHPDISLRIQNLLNYWKKQYETTVGSIFLRKKHLRANEIETDAESEELVVVWKKRKLSPEKMKKVVSINLTLNNVLFFDREAAPIQIQYEKNKYDPLLFY